MNASAQSEGLAREAKGRFGYLRRARLEGADAKAQA